MAEPTQTSKAFEKPPQYRAQTGGGFFSAFSFAVFKFSTIIIVLAASGLVQYGDVLSVLLASVYLYIMSRYVFPPVTLETPPSVYKGSKVNKVYITFAAYVGLYLPFTYIMLGVAMGDKTAVQTAATHTFLLASQVVSERLTVAFSLPARALVPILYNSGRLVSIWAWIQSDFFKGTHASSLRVSKGPLSATHWVLLGRSLVVVNLVLWSFNLFCFLIPMYLPICFRKYFEDEKAWSEQRSKTE